MQTAPTGELSFVLAPQTPQNPTNPLYPLSPTPPPASEDLPSCPVVVGPVNTSIDPCRWIVQGVLALVGWVIDTITLTIDQFITALSQSEVLFSTPHALTDQNQAVLTLSFALWIITWFGLAFIVATQGYALILGPHLGGGFRYAEAREVLPRLCLGALAATIAPFVIGQLIDFSNLLCSAAVTTSFLPVTAPSLATLGTGANPTLAVIFLALTVLAYSVFAFLVVLQIFIRLATLNLLIVVAPLAIICWILPQTRIWTDRWTTLFCGVLLTQPMQIITIALGLTIANSVPKVTGVGQLLGDIPLPTIEALICLGTFYVAFKLPRVFSQFALGPTTVGAAFDALRTGSNLVRTGLLVAGLW